MSKGPRSMELEDWVLDIIVCPKCRAGLRADDAASELVCTGCGLAYPVRDNIPVLLIEEARQPEGHRRERMNTPPGGAALAALPPRRPGDRRSGRSRRDAAADRLVGRAGPHGAPRVRRGRPVRARPGHPAARHRGGGVGRRGRLGVRVRRARGDLRPRGAGPGDRGVRLPAARLDRRGRPGDRGVPVRAHRRGARAGRRGGAARLRPGRGERARLAACRSLSRGPGARSSR